MTGRENPTKRVMLVYGTRPEAIKMAPVVRELHDSPRFTPIVVLTGQHASMLDQVNADFGITADHNLEIMAVGQSLQHITSRALDGVSRLIAAEQPDVVAVQGDTTSALAAGLAAFYAHVPVAHLEAGLRTDDIYSPFPEEMNRRLTSQLASLHLAPTPASRANLLRENVDRRSIVVTGNTVIDSLLWTVERDRPFSNPRLREIEREGSPVLLVTAHRRESWGDPMRRVAEALVEISWRLPELHIVLPAHRNPIVREVLLPILQRGRNIDVLEPLPYPDFTRLLWSSRVVLTDSGGVQEEAPSLGKPVLVMRESTERPEGIGAGTARLVGTSSEAIVTQVETLMRDESAYRAMARAVNPYGDGRAAWRTIRALSYFFGEGPAPQDFAPDLANSTPDRQAFGNRVPDALPTAS
jgi:UDP-N-acetylglucosamine 2-epimerase (non-hydrolysing)